MFSDTEGDSSMKKAISILLFLMMTVLLCSGAMAATYQTGTYSTAENTSEDGVITYTLVTEDDGTKYARISGYEGTSARITIHESIGAYPVIQIDNQVFDYNDCIEEVVIYGSNLQVIDYEAFNRCKNLTKINFPSSLVEIGSSAFAYCESLKDYNEDASFNIAYVGKNAFDHCTSLESAHFLANATYIGKSAFGSCSVLKNITLSPSLETLGTGAFAFTALTEFTFPPKILDVPSAVLNGCENLETLVLAEGTRSIASVAFANCVKITEFSIPDSVTSIDQEFIRGTSITEFDWPERFTTIPAYMFADCKYLTEFTIPDTVTKIETGAFSGTAIESFTVPLWMTHIPDHLLRGCSNLREIILHDNLQLIGEKAFAYTAITELDLPDSLTTIQYGALSGCTGLTKLDIPSSVVSIGNVAFEGCSGLTELVIPESILSLGHNMFANCTSLKKITLPPAIQSIANSMFKNCSALESIDIPESVSVIGDSAFKGCTSLKSLHIPDGATTIGESAFENCTSLASIYLPDSLETFSESSGYLAGTFANCTALESIVIPGSISNIYGETFYNCTALRTVVVKEYPDILDPQKVMTIAYNAFRACTALEKVYLPRTLYTLESSAFPYNSKTKYYLYSDSTWLEGAYLPSSQIVYLDDADFSEYGLILMDSALVMNAGSVFTLTPFFCPEGYYTPTWTSSNENVATVADGVVTAHNEGTATITVNVSGVTASALVTVTKIEGLMPLPASLTVIGQEAFTGIKAKYVVVPATVTEIGANAFDNCPGGMSVEITSSSINIDEDAFGDTSVVIVCPDGSPAMEFAVANGYTYQIK